jgi:SAM-dependent methyltransferase
MNGPASLSSRMRHYAREGVDNAQRALATAGITQSETTIARDAQSYWRSPDAKSWRSNSHWRDAPAFAGGDLWDRIGRRHLAMLEAVAPPSDAAACWGRIVEWGCGGGANAVHLAPRCREFIGVDVALDSLQECERQVEAVSQNAFRPVLIDVDRPEEAVAAIGEPCDVFVCFYVFELVPTPEYGQRILGIASRLLVPGGHALVQIKYDDGTWRTRARRRGYRFGLADMTTYPIARFWEAAAAAGLRPESVRLRPRDDLDDRYAYFHLRKPHQ